MRLSIALLWCGVALSAADFHYDTETGAVSIAGGGKTLLSSPAEGLWSIACDWRDQWPAEWHHGRPASVAQQGDWTVLRGEVQACGGVWEIQDAYRPEAGVVKAIRRFTWKGAVVAPKVTLSIRFQTITGSAMPLLPGILYSGNPSGAKNTPNAVPVYTGRPGEQAIYEEHRYPMPFAFAEIGSTGAALHSVPSPAPYGNLVDQWWSLGIQALADRSELILLSGPCASNGQRSVIKGLQKKFLPYDNAYLNVQPGAIIEKTFYLEAFPVERPGSGFQRAVHTSLALFAPERVDDMPSMAQIVRDKYRFLKTRWHDMGFKKYADRTYYVMGWTGGAEAPGYALQVLAPGLQDPDAIRMAERSLFFLSGVEFLEGGFHTWFEYQKHEWSRYELVNQGQAMLNFARAIRVGRKRGVPVSRWESFLLRASAIHAHRILRPDWKPVSTNEAFFIAPLLESYQLFHDDVFRQAGVKAAEYYARRHLDMKEPYWGGTNDAKCEDKEGAYGAFQGWLALYEQTKNPEHLRWAEHAANVVLSYLVDWDIDLPAGRLRDHRLRTRGWTVVSPQNQHLDVFGVIIAPDLYELGGLKNDSELQRVAVLMYRSCGQMIDPSGSQGEQLNYTNYNTRGTYHENWTVLWITTHFLTGAARFSELGVKVWE